MTCTTLKPCAWPASNCPWAMEFSPPRMISAMTEEVNRIKATAALNSSFVSTVVSPNSFRLNSSGQGQNTRQMKIHSSNGVFRNTSMYTVAIIPNIFVVLLVQ